MDEFEKKNNLINDLRPNILQLKKWGQNLI
jgi:hypothetical protein